MTGTDFDSGIGTEFGDGPSHSVEARWTPGVIVSRIERCSGEARWNKGRLEQLWLVQNVGTLGHIESVDEEWRPVPEVSDS